MKRKKKGPLIAAIIVMILLVLAGAALLTLYLPYYRAQNDMPTEAELTLTEQEDGRLLLRWPESDSAQYYLVQVLRPMGEGEEPVWLFRKTVADSTQCVLPRLSAEEPLIIQVNSAVDFERLGETETRYGEKPLEVTTSLAAPTLTGLEWTADPAAKAVTVSFSMAEGDLCRCWVTDANGEKRELKTLSQQQMTLSFGEGGEVAMPAYGERSTFTFDVYRQEPGLTFYGSQCAEFTVVREDLLGRDLAVEFTDLGDNRCTLTWNETKGAYYEVQVQNTQQGQWETVARIDADQAHTYSSPRMDPCEHYIYRVVALGGQAGEEIDQVPISQEFDLITAESPIYATIWPTKDLEAYASPGDAEAAGTAKGGQAYCVLEERDGMFAVMVDGQTLYIDSNYCMINLPEYMGRLCSYNITNSYDSIYMVHEYEIPEVTGVVTGGYEKVAQRDGSYLVPLLYPTAQKLAVAAKEAAARGYRLKIYDAFRPHKATREIYDLTEAILQEPLPEETCTGVEVELPKPKGEWLTYQEAMTGGTYKLGAFLAQGASMHNLGIALDLTLEELETGTELSMQTSMHDLSFYSVLRNNNDEANILADIMKGAGFGELTSEWWHFQDNEIRKALTLPTVWAGVSGECWMADDSGWKYRTAGGSCYSNCTVTIGDRVYTFDAEGYVVSE